jgi:hypothetical protein
MLYKDQIIEKLKTNEEWVKGFVWSHPTSNTTQIKPYLIDIKQFYPTIILNAIDNDLITENNIPKNINLKDTKENLRWFLENKSLIKSGSETLYTHWLSRVNTLYPKLKTTIPPIYSKLIYNDILSLYESDIIYINVDMIVVNNPTVINDIINKLSNIYIESKLNPNEFITITELQWFIQHNNQYMYVDINNKLKDLKLSKNLPDVKKKLLQTVKEDIRHYKLNKLLNN